MPGQLVAAADTMSAALGVDLRRCRPPRLPDVTVARRRLVDRVVALRSPSLVLVTAPAASGKTAIAADVALAVAAPVAWLSVPPEGWDADALLRHLLVALEPFLPLPDAVLDAVEVSAPWRSILAKLANALGAERFVLVVDDAHHLADVEAVECLGRILDSSGWACDVVVCGRTDRDLRLGRLRLSRTVLRVGARDLALSAAQIGTLAHSLDVTVTPPDVERLVHAMEGWEGGVRLALETGPDEWTEDLLAPGVVDYLRDEVVARADDEERRFLVLTSPLDTLNGSLCDAVADGTGSALLLTRLCGRGQLFVEPVADVVGTFRVRKVFRAFLRQELAQSGPDVVNAVHELASRWFETRGDMGAAVTEARAAGAHERSGALVHARALLMSSSDRSNAMLGQWLAGFTAEECRASAELCLSQAYWCLAERRGNDAAEWVSFARAHVDRGPLADGTPSLAIALAVLLTWLGNDPGDVLLTDLAPALVHDPTTSPLVAVAHVLAATLRWMLGEPDVAAAMLHYSEPGWMRVPVVRCVANVYLAMIADDEGDHDAATLYRRRAERTMREERLSESAWLLNPRLALAVMEARDGDVAELSERAEVARTMLGEGLGRNASRVRLFTTTLLAEVHLLLDDPATAREHVSHAELLGRREAWAKGLQARLDRVRVEVTRSTESHAFGGPASLTKAELRVLAYLPTHLSLREIAEATYRSVHTVKSQTVSAYRKLGVKSRSQAVQRGRELGLIDA